MEELNRKLLAFVVPDIRHNKPVLRIEKFMVFNVCRDVHICPFFDCFADQKAAGSATYGYFFDWLVKQFRVPDAVGFKSLTDKF